MVNRWYFGVQMAEQLIQELLPDQAAPSIIRRKVFAIGWIQGKLLQQNVQPADTIGNLNVLGMVVVEDEFGSEHVPADLK
jgi:hypothetical protein